MGALVQVNPRVYQRLHKFTLEPANFDKFLYEGKGLKYTTVLLNEGTNLDAINNEHFRLLVDYELISGTHPSIWLPIEVKECLFRTANSASLAEMIRDEHLSHTLRGYCSSTVPLSDP